MKWRRVVEGDIWMYIETSLAEINGRDGDQSLDGWPSPSELSKLISQCGKLRLIIHPYSTFQRDSSSNK
jgi:hypothetical protein